MTPGISPEGLALRARTALADARSVTLVIRGVGRVRSGDPAVLLHDRGGSPTFYCPVGSPVTAAARLGCAAVLTVVGCDDTGRMLTVIVCGRLAQLPGETRHEETVDVIGLTPATVWIEEDDPDSHHLVQRAVPLELYARAEPDPLGPCAARLAAHTTRSHQAQLRAVVAERTGRPLREVAGVRLCDVGPDGAELQWVAPDGAHLLRLAFEAPARTPRELALRLRGALAT